MSHVPEADHGFLRWQDGNLDRAPSYYYRPQRSWAKVMFLQASVILSTGGGWFAPGGMGVSNFSGGLQIFFSFFFQFFSPKFLLGCTNPPPLQTVNARPVRILLECILVWQFFLPKRMHSSRMRTGRALTVSGGGVDF